MNMRPFNKSDWDCFAGCESETPYIGECSIEIIDEHPWQAVIIRDGCTVVFYSEGETDRGHDESVEIKKEFSREETAVYWTIECPENVSLFTLLGHGFEIRREAM